ncbi:MAG TPA: GDSL-type esterase/lipase family protein [Vicinamibacterales bacterium]
MADAPSISCIEGISRSTTSADGVSVNYDTPSTSNGQGSVIVSCSPAAGQMFPIGSTAVSCTATDTLNRTATCSFNVTVSKLPTLSKTRFLAFGDSITAGEVTFPVGSQLIGAASITKQVQVLSAAYPTVLLNTLRGRYASQAGSMEVFNYGFGGEKVVNSRNRFLSALAATRPDVLILMEGANDIPAGEDGAASSAAQEISVWVATAKAQGIRVFLATPTPGRPGGNRTINPLLLVDYAGRMRRVAEQQGVTLVDIYTLMLPDVQRYIGVDGLHPNELGYARLADLFFQAIQSALEVR